MNHPPRALSLSFSVLLCLLSLATACSSAKNSANAADGGAALGNSGNGSAGQNGGSGANGGAGAAGNSSGNTGGSGSSASGSGAGANGGAGASAGTGGSGTTITFDDNLPAAGNPDGHCAIPADAQAENSSKPDHVVGTGTEGSCTSRAFVDAVAQGGVITFNCGPDPVTISLDETAKIFNDKGPKIVIDGGGKVTISGGGKVRILYQNTCDQAQTWTTSHCDDQPEPQLTVQNITLRDGNAKSETDGGGAIFVRGGRLKIVNTRFFGNVCADVGPDIGGGAVRAFDQSMKQPVYVVNSTFGGAQELGNVCSNGGGLSSIGLSYTVLNSAFSYNKAIGNGANPAQTNTPGGGSGGAIYNDGNTFTLTLCGTHMEHNTANEGGGAIFFVSNDRSGTLSITDSVLMGNPSAKFETLPGIFVQAKGMPTIVNSTIAK